MSKLGETINTYLTGLRGSKALRALTVAATVTHLAVAPAWAADSSTASTSNSNSGAVAIINNGGSGHSTGKIRQRVETTASAIAPGLTAAGVHSCAGSASLGVGATGFNFGVGSTYEMIECNRRAYAATLSGMGQNAAALALICNNGEVMTALNQTGVICPQQVTVTGSVQGTAPAVQASSPTIFAASTSSTGRNPCHSSSTADVIECGKRMNAATAQSAAPVPATPQRRR